MSPEIPTAEPAIIIIQPITVISQSMKGDRIMKPAMIIRIPINTNPPPPALVMGHLRSSIDMVSTQTIKIAFKHVNTYLIALVFTK